jgi:hypothetical protein
MRLIWVASSAWGGDTRLYRVEGTCRRLPPADAPAFGVNRRSRNRSSIRFLAQHAGDAQPGLEAEAIGIVREVAAEFRRPVMLYIGKDSSVMLHIALKAFRAMLRLDPPGDPLKVVALSMPGGIDVGCDAAGERPRISGQDPPRLSRVCPPVGLVRSRAGGRRERTAGNRDVCFEAGVGETTP